MDVTGQTVHQVAQAGGQSVERLTGHVFLRPNGCGEVEEERNGWNFFLTVFIFIPFDVIDRFRSGIGPRSGHRTRPTASALARRLIRAERLPEFDQRFVIVQTETELVLLADGIRIVGRIVRLVAGRHRMIGRTVEIEIR